MRRQRQVWGVPDGTWNSCAAAAANPIPGLSRPAMRRVVSLYLPTWPTDRNRRRHGAPPADEPLVTVRTEGSRRLVGAVDHAAHAAGLRPGQTIVHAQALVPNLHIAEGRPDEDEATLHELARWCIGYSPIVAPDPPDGIWQIGRAHV